MGLLPYGNSILRKSRSIPLFKLRRSISVNGPKAEPARRLSLQPFRLCARCDNRKISCRVQMIPSNLLCEARSSSLLRPNGRGLQSVSYGRSVRPVDRSVDKRPSLTDIVQRALGKASHPVWPQTKPIRAWRNQIRSEWGQSAHLQ